MNRQPLKFAILALTIAILGFGWSYRIFSESPVVIPKNGTITFIATLDQEPRLNDKNQILKVADLLIYTDLFPRYRVGDRLKITADVNSEGLVFSPQIETVGRKAGFPSYFSEIRNRLSANINSLLPSREATLVGGTVLGIDSIDREFKNQLVKTGTIHVVVVSGQNLTIIAGLFISFSRYLGRRNSLILATLAVLLYALLTGFQPPVIRATLMVIASTLAVFFGREAQALWTLVLAALVIIFVWPHAAFEISFQLTFAATFGIITLGNFLAKKWRKLPFLGENAAISTSAFIFTAPVILYYFGQISPISPIANILVIEAVFPIMILGFLTAIFSLILMPIAALIAYAAYLPAFYFTKVVELFSSLPVGQFEIGEGNLILLIASYVVIFGLTLLWRQSGSKV